MKTLITISCILASVTLFAEVKQPKQELSDAEKAAKKAEFYKKTGGLVRRPKTGSGKVVFINSQDKFKIADLQALAGKLSDIMKIDFEVIQENGVDLSNAAEFMKKSNAPCGAIAAKLAPTMPELIVVPDSGYAIINVSAFPADASSKYFSKQLVRGFAAASGAMSSQYPLTLMSAFENSKKLDSFPSEELPVDVMIRVKNSLKQNGVAPYAVTTYKHACREGWAHQPTNDVEKAIWKEMHDEKERGPINGIKIQP